jgi:hypothetical protein
MASSRPHDNDRKKEAVRFRPHYLLSYWRDHWAYRTGPKRIRFEAESDAHAITHSLVHLSRLGRRKARGGTPRAKLEFRDRHGIWHSVQLTEGGAL